MGTCNDYPRCWGVGILLTRIAIVGNELAENRNSRLCFNKEEIVCADSNIRLT